MADGITVDTSELTRFERGLARAGIEIVKVNEAELTKAAKQLKSDAQSDAPVDKGDLSRSGRISGGKEFRRVRFTDRAAFYQEFGTSRHAAQPFLFHNGDRAGVSMSRELGKGGHRLLLKA